MKKLMKLTTLSITVGMLLAACEDADDNPDDPATEEPADDTDGLEDFGDG